MGSGPRLFHEKLTDQDVIDWEANIPTPSPFCSLCSIVTSATWVSKCVGAKTGESLEATHWGRGNKLTQRQFNEQRPKCNGPFDYWNVGGTNMEYGVHGHKERIYTWNIILLSADLCTSHAGQRRKITPPTRIGLLKQYLRGERSAGN